jgi:hypothetical protein
MIVESDKRTMSEARMEQIADSRLLFEEEKFRQPDFEFVLQQMLKELRECKS